jgi:hypothetical protein
MSVIRLVGSTCTGLEWIGAQNLLEYPFAPAGGAPSGDSKQLAVNDPVVQPRRGQRPHQITPIR